MRVLVLGGTVFVGRQVVEAAVARGHEVTVFHRGRHPCHRDDVAELLGDRRGGLAALGGASWDAVVDSSGYLPAVVDQSARALQGRVGRYLFVSTVSVYADVTDEEITESAPLHEPPPDSADEVSPETYGPLKVACERVVAERYGGRAAIVRPGIVAGPHDPTGRFTYWVRRCARGGEILAPGRPHAPVQLIDARDLGSFAVRLLEEGRGGTWNAVGPDRPTTMADLIAACLDATAGVATPTWVPDGPLTGLGARAGDFPLWLPQTRGAGIFRVRNEAAKASGLRLRPLAETAAAVHAWRPRDQAVTGVDAARERELLAGWRAQAGR